MTILNFLGLSSILCAIFVASDAAIKRTDKLYGPRYRPLWEKGAKTRYTTNFGPSSLKHMTENAGLIYENYTLTTEDGYIINLNRILHPDSVKKKDKGFPLFLMNGFMMHSDGWVVQKEMDSNIAFVWAALGYDVWLGDQRGTVRSIGHVNMSSDIHNKEYWDHAFEEIGVYDTPTFIDFILENTGYKKLNFMCISMGCSFHAVLISAKPEYNEKILAAFYFVPLVNNINRVLDMPAPIQINFLLGEMNTKIHEVGMWGINFYRFWDAESNEAKIMTLVRTVPVSYEDQGIYVIAPRLSGIKKELFYSCSPFVNVITSLLKSSLNGALHYPDTACYITGLSIGGGSTKTARQVLQVYKDATFAKYDYGRKKNMELYGQEAPPLYNISKITSFVAIYYSDADGFSSVEGAKNTLKELNGPTYECVMPHFSHFDVAGGTVFKYILPDVIEVLNSVTGYSDDRKKYLSGKCPSMEWVRNLN